MSIIIGLVTKKRCYVGSDGRLTGPAEFNNGIIVMKAKPIDDTYNKTFVIEEHKIIGAVAGLMSFSGKRVDEHLLDIYGKQCNGIQNPKAIGDISEANVKESLEHINPVEVMFGHRKCDLIIIYKDSNEFTIQTMSFIPNILTNTIDCTNTIKLATFVDDKQVHWYLFGDNLAQEAANRMFEAKFNKTKDRTQDVLKSLIEDSITNGIRCCEVHPLGNDKSCGGKIYTQILK